MPGTERRRVYKKLTSNLVDFLRNSCVSILGQDGWREFLGPVDGDPKYRLPVHLFAPCAGIILAARTLPTMISSGVLYDLDENIRLRTSLSRLFEPIASSDGTVKKKYDRHMHFIGVLKRVRGLLQMRANEADHHSTVSFRRVDEQPETTTRVRQGAGYEVLSSPSDGTSQSSEEGNATPSNHSASSKPSRNKMPPISVVKPDPRAQAEQTLLLDCFLAEIGEILPFCRRLWQAYSRHELSLRTAAMVTNAAFALVETRTEQYILEAESIEGLPESDRRPIACYGVQKYLFDISRSLGIFEINEESTHMTRDDYRLSNLLWEPSIDVAMEYWGLSEQDDSERLEFLRRTDTPDPISEASETADARDFASLYQYRVSVARTLLREFVRFSALVPPTKDALALDSLTFEFWKHSEKPYVSRWASMGLQLLVDAHETLGADIMRPWEELTALKSHTQERVLRHLPVVGPYLTVLHGLVHGEDIVLPAAAKRRKTSRAKSRKKNREGYGGTDGKITDPAVTTRPQDFALIKLNPVLSGVRSYVLLDCAQALSIESANYTRIMPLALHWYRILKDFGGLTCTWMDAEFIIEHCGPEAVFGGSSPTTLKAAADRIRMLHEGDRLVFAHPFEQPFSKAVHRWMYGSGKGEDLSFLPLQQFVVQQIANEERDQVPPTAQGTTRPRKRDTEAYRAWAISVHRTGKNAHGDYTPLRILWKLAHHMAEQEMHSYFDYFSMQFRCEKLLIGIVAIFRPNLSIKGLSRRDAAEIIVLACISLLEEMAGDPENEELKADLNKVNDLFETMVAEEGRAEINAAEILAGVEVGKGSVQGLFTGSDTASDSQTDGSPAASAA
jgi:hypothetical protein